MLSLYALKPRFQAWLRPAVARLAAAGVTANGVTVATAAVSCLLGGFLAASANPSWFLLLPLWLAFRMAFNAIDGMLAREHGQQSSLGAYLNELGDVVSDAALYLPFVLVPPFGWASVGAVILLSCISELTGILGISVGAGRRYEGPMGKSDRATVFGALGLVFGWSGQLPQWAFWLMPAIAALIAINIVNRVRCGLANPSYSERST